MRAPSGPDFDGDPRSQAAWQRRESRLRPGLLRRGGNGREGPERRRVRQARRPEPAEFHSGAARRNGPVGFDVHDARQGRLTMTSKTAPRIVGELADRIAADAERGRRWTRRQARECARQLAADSRLDAGEVEALLDAADVLA